MKSRYLVIRRQRAHCFQSYFLPIKRSNKTGMPWPATASGTLYCAHRDLHQSTSTAVPVQSHAMHLMPSYACCYGYASMRLLPIIFVVPSSVQRRSQPARVSRKCSEVELKLNVYHKIDPPHINNSLATLLVDPWRWRTRRISGTHTLGSRGKRAICR